MLSLTAREIMTRDVYTIKKGSSIEEALRKMACNGISGLPVVDVEDHIVGIITESDVLMKGQHPFLEKYPKSNPLTKPRTEGLEEAYRRAQSDLVEEAMTRKVLIFDEESLVVDIARAMMEHAVNRVPIVRDRKVVGIVSRRDIIRAMARVANNGLDCERCHDEVRTGRLIEL